MQQKLASASVFHDLQKNVYYRIDKQTGQILRSHKNGSILTSFKTDITGSDYKKRLELEHAIEKRIIKRKFVIPKERNSHHFASDKLFTLNRLQNEKDYSPRKNNRKDISPLNNSRLKSQETEINFLTNFNTIEESVSKSNNQIEKLLKSFEKISEQKVYDNHCSLGKNSGTIINTKLLRNSKGFRQTKNIVYQPYVIPKKIVHNTFRTVSQNNDSRQHWNHQISKEKKVFLQFHPLYENHQNYKIIQEQVQRKKNIKKLEQLFLDQTSKITDKIYS